MKKKNLKTGKRAPELKRGKPVRVQRLVSRLDAMLEMWEAAWLHLVQRQDFDGAGKIRPIKSAIQEIRKEAQAANDKMRDRDE
jgi:hypothetical protein